MTGRVMRRAPIVAATLLVAGLGAGMLAGAQSAAADDVVVKTVDDRFEPAEITLEHGKPYRLRIENVGKDMHEFKAPAFFAAAKITGGADAMTPDRTELVVQPGQTKQVELVAPAPGSYAVTCPDHDWDDMVGKIVVR
jgi:uncharacterized cupredoxin-like copper-binding protein